MLEYLVWQVFDQKIDGLSLQNGDYVPLLPDEDGIIRSRVFPGLWLGARTLNHIKRQHDGGYGLQ